MSDDLAPRRSYDSRISELERGLAALTEHVDIELEAITARITNVHERALVALTDHYSKGSTRMSTPTPTISLERRRELVASFRRRADRYAERAQLEYQGGDASYGNELQAIANDYRDAARELEIEAVQ